MLWMHICLAAVAWRRFFGIYPEREGAGAGSCEDHGEAVGGEECEDRPWPPAW